MGDILQRKSSSAKSTRGCPARPGYSGRGSMVQSQFLLHSSYPIYFLFFSFLSFLPLLSFLLSSLVLFFPSLLSFSSFFLFFLSLLSFFSFFSLIFPQTSPAGKTCPRSSYYKSTVITWQRETSNSSTTCGLSWRRSFAGLLLMI